MNKEKSNTHTRKWYSTSGRKAHFKRQYNLTLEEYDQMFKDQNGCCKICNTSQTKLKKILCVDHDHKTGLVRGLLCHNCNRMLGSAKDSKEVLLNAIEYLKQRAASKEEAAHQLVGVGIVTTTTS